MSDINIRSHFYNAAEVELNKGSGGFKPSAAFEIKNGLSNVASYYKFPEKTIDGETARYALFFETYAARRYTAAVFACYENPRENGLKIIKISDLAPELMKGMIEDWETLKALNPELAQVQVDVNDPLNVFDALIGAACLFNVDDINFFVTNRQKEKSMAVDSYVSKIPDYWPLYNEVSQAAEGNYLGWVPAPQTLQKIKAALIP